VGTLLSPRVIPARPAVVPSEVKVKMLPFTGMLRVDLGCDRPESEIRVQGGGSGKITVPP
jgi:hypothetical protein